MRDQGLDFEIIIVGDGPLRGEIEQLIDQSDLRERMRITGYLSNEGYAKSYKLPVLSSCPASPRVYPS